MCKVEVLLVLALTWAVETVPAGQRSGKHEMLQKRLKTLMPHKEKGVVRGEGQLVPRYMLDLYSEFRDRDVVTGGGAANTVRSISAEIGE